MERRGEIGPVPPASLWPRWAKLARNGAAESRRCSSGQWGADDGGIGRVPAVSFREGCGWRAPCEGLLTAARRSKSSRIRGLQRAKNARNWQVRAGRSSPSGWKRFLSSSQKGESWRLHRRGCRRPRGRRLPLGPSPAARAMGGESAHPCFGRRTAGGANPAQFGVLCKKAELGWLSNFAWCCHMMPSASPHRQIKREHAVRAVSHRFVCAYLCRSN